MRKFVTVLGLGLALGCFGACGDDLGTPKPDGGGPDGGKPQLDGGAGASEAGPVALDGGNKSEANSGEAGAGDLSDIANSGVLDTGGVADAPSIPDLAKDTSPLSFVDGGVDAGTVDTGSGVDATKDFPAGVDSGIVDGAAQIEVGQIEVGIDSLGPLDGSSLSLVVPAAGERFSPPLPNADSLPSGVWYCDMGTVHWAQGDRGTGKCPICGMDLVQKT